MARIDDLTAEIETRYENEIELAAKIARRQASLDAEAANEMDLAQQLSPMLGQRERIQDQLRAVTLISDKRAWCPNLELVAVRNSVPGDPEFEEGRQVAEYRLVDVEVAMLDHAAMARRAVLFAADLALIEDEAVRTKLEELQELRRFQKRGGADLKRLREDLREQVEKRCKAQERKVELEAELERKRQEAERKRLEKAQARAAKAEVRAAAKRAKREGELF